MARLTRGEEFNWGIFGEGGGAKYLFFGAEASTKPRAFLGHKRPRKIKNTKEKEDQGLVLRRCPQECPKVSPKKRTLSFMSEALDPLCSQKVWRKITLVKSKGI